MITLLTASMNDCHAGGATFSEDGDDNDDDDDGAAVLSFSRRLSMNVSAVVMSFDCAATAAVVDFALVVDGGMFDALSMLAFDEGFKAEEEEEEVVIVVGVVFERLRVGASDVSVMLMR